MSRPSSGKVKKGEGEKGEKRRFVCLVDLFYMVSLDWGVG